MNYEFPHIESIDDVLPHIKGRDEFRVTDKGDYTVINYMVNFEETFKWNEDDALGCAIRRECRGLAFDTEGEIISRPYHKFFNVNEKEETKIDKIDLTHSHVVLEKLDGSMIRTLPLNGGFRLGTRAGITDVSENAEAFIADKPQYTTFINECAKKGATPIFEWCSRKNRIVIDYPEDQLILTGIRYQLSGTYFQYKIMVNYANAWNIPVIKAIAGGEKNLQNIVDHIRTWHDSEGVIIRFNYDGHMLKIKADDYCLKHTTKDSISFEKNVIQVILNDGVDDLIPLLTENDAQRLLDFQKAFWLSIDEVALDIHGMYMEGYKIESQKDFATQFITKYPQKYAPFLYGMRKGMNLKDMLKESIGKSLSTQTKVDEARWMFGDIHWNT